MICDTYFLMDVMGCVKEAYIRAPPLPLYYDALAAAVQEARERQEEEEALDRQSEAGRGERVSAGSSSPLAIFKERLVLYDNDHTFDAKQLSIKGGCVLQELDGMTRDQMFDAYKRAVVVIDLWLPGAETVTAEGAMFDCCILVPNEMNGANERDFPIASDLKIRRLENGHWNYTQISDLLNRALDEYDEFVGEFRALKRHVMALPDAFQASVHRYFSNDIHFVAAAFTKEEQELVLPWAVSVLMNYPLASIDILVHNRMQFGLAYAGVLEVLRHRGIKQSITVSDALPGYGAQAYLGRSSGPRTFNGAVRESSLTCFADPRTTVLRPDLLELVEANSSAWDLLNAQLLTGEDRGGEVGERSVGLAKGGRGGGGLRRTQNRGWLGCWNVCVPRIFLLFRRRPGGQIWSRLGGCVTGMDFFSLTPVGGEDEEEREAGRFLTRTVGILRTCTQTAYTEVFSRTSPLATGTQTQTPT